MLLVACGGGEDGDSTEQASTAREQARETKAATQAIAGLAGGSWGSVQSLPLVPASAANLPDGRILLWAADDRFSFGQTGQSYTVVFDPVSGQNTERFVNQTGQNMFCPGTTNLADGRILVSGGSNAAKTSIYDPATGDWRVAQQMQIPRAYQANTLLSDGSVLTLGGSWAGGAGNKHAELWTAAGGWRLLPGVRVDDFMTADATGAYRSDNHMWLLPAGNGKVFHAGPSVKMHWIDTVGNGSVAGAGLRGDDQDSMSGNATMYDTGRILKVGGSPQYENVNATSASYVIDIQNGTRVRKLAPMAYARAFHNSVVLPNGQVMIIGGQSYPVPFSDNTSVLVPELWDPVSEQFTALPPMRVPRNYHSVALLLPDARVMSAGGGLCGAGCAGNHPDLQIYSPHYLFNADGSPAQRPTITAAPTTATYGQAIEVATNSPVTAFALVRLSSTTHTVNNDQRRLALRYTRVGENRYAVTLPTNPGWALPGHYMLFAMDARGVPSVARIVKLGKGSAPSLAPVAEQTSVAGVPAQVSLQASGATGLQASGLPPGVTLDKAGAKLVGTPAVPGRYQVSVTASNTAGAIGTEFTWQVGAAGATRYIRFEQLSDINGTNWASIAELNVLDAEGKPLNRSAWSITPDSEERAAENGAAVNAIDGNPNTFWHTAWSQSSPPPPHQVVIDMGRMERVTALRYLPRQIGANGIIARYRIYTSPNGVQWGAPVAEGDMRSINPSATAEKTVTFATGGSSANYAPVITAPGDQAHYVNEPLALQLFASDDQSAALRYEASGLPPGLVLRPATGEIAGTATAVGVYPVTVKVTDAMGAASSTTFTWHVLALSPPQATVAAPVIVAGTNASFTAKLTGSSADLRFSWDFGDDSPATAFSAAPTVSHAYATAGLYAVTLQLRSTDGQTVVHRFTQAVAGSASVQAAPATASLLLEPAGPSNGPRLWTVNQDNDTVSVFDATNNTKLAEIPVGKAPRSLTWLPGTRQVWVANRDDAGISMIDADRRTVVRTLALRAAAQPWGVLADPASKLVYVSLEATGQLLQLEADGKVRAELMLGGTPRHMALTPAGLLVSRFVSAPQPGESTATVRATENNAPVGGEVWVVGTAPLALRKTIVLKHSAKPDSTTQGRGVPNYLQAAALAPDGLSVWLPSKQDNLYRGTLRDGKDLDFQNTVRAIGSRIDLASLSEDTAARIDHDNASIASASTFHPSGAYLFTALETSRHVAVVDPVGRRELFRVDTGRAPQALAVSADGRTLYVGNFMDRSIGVYDLTPLVQYGQMTLPQRAVLAAVGTEKLTPQVLLGKQLFYDARDPRLARDAYMSCATCHNDGGHDGRTWDMTGRGEGLRNTISLRGRAGGQGRLHWSGNFDEVQDFEAQIRTLAGGTGLMSDAQFNAGTRSQPLGAAKAGLSTDLDALAAYVTSLNNFAPSPWRAAGGGLSPQAQLGRAVFRTQCVSCHGEIDFTRSDLGTLSDIGSLKSTSGKRLGGALTGIDIPTLRDTWSTAPYLHDGSAPTIEAAVRAHTRIPALSAADLASVTAYVQQIDGTEPAFVHATGRYVRFEAQSEVRGGPWASMAEFELLDLAGKSLPRGAWRIHSRSSEETTAENASALNILDGKPETIWHTAYSAVIQPMPHWVVIDTGSVQTFGGFRYTPRANGFNGTVANYLLQVSNDPTKWGTPVSRGTLATAANAASAKTIRFNP